MAHITARRGDIVNICDCFEKIPFPMHVFNPMQKEEFDKHKHCIPWPPLTPPPCPPCPKRDCAILKLVEEDDYVNLPDDKKLKHDVLWVVYPNGFL